MGFAFEEQSAVLNSSFYGDFGSESRQKLRALTVQLR